MCVEASRATERVDRSVFSQQLLAALEGGEAMSELIAKSAHMEIVYAGSTGLTAQIPWPRRCPRTTS